MHKMKLNQEFVADCCFWKNVCTYIRYQALTKVLQLLFVALWIAYKGS